MKRILAGLIFLAILLTALVGGHVYLLNRLVFDLGLDPGTERWAVFALVLLGGSIFLEPFAERLLPRPASRFVTWPAGIWMGLGFLLIVLLGASDFAGWVAGPAALAAGGDGSETAVAWARGRAVGVLGLAGTAGVIALVSALTPPSLRRVAVTLDRWPAALDGFRIVQISDIHIGPILDGRFARRLVERCNALEPDLLAVTGDLVDGDAEALRDEVAPFADLRARHGVFFVTGNHDYFSGVDPWVERVRELGLRVLRNERVAISQDGAGFDLAGVDDHRGDFRGSGGEDLDAALADRDPARPVVLLAHDPTTFKRASQLGVDLQISGHTHGGQIWPFRYLVRLVVPWVAGLYREGAAAIYVSRGTGFWGPPMRLFAPAEITELVLRSPTQE